MMLEDEESGEPMEIGEPEVNEMAEGNSFEVMKGDASTKKDRLKEVGLSLKSVAGLTSPKTMKLQGEIG